MLLEDSKREIEAIVRRVVREELEPLWTAGVLPARLSLSLPDAAAATGYSVEGLRQAIARNELVPSYANTKPVITVEELVRWLRSLPDEPRRR